MTREEIIEKLLEKYAFSTGDAFIVLAKEIKELLDDYDSMMKRE